MLNRFDEQLVNKRHRARKRILFILWNIEIFTHLVNAMESIFPIEIISPP